MFHVGSLKRYAVALQTTKHAASDACAECGGGIEANDTRF
jgi:hypothetical protein